MRIWIPLAVVLGLVFGSSGTANAGHLWHSFFCYKETCNSCRQCPNVCHSVGCQFCLNFAHLDSTCDMYQHHAYYPECHGSYYFRPYNWEHFAQDTPLMLGLGNAAPYSEDGFRDLKPVQTPKRVEQPVIRVTRAKLPNLEDLLKKSSEPTPVLPAPPSTIVPPKPAK